MLSLSVADELYTATRRPRCRVEQARTAAALAAFPDAAVVISADSTIDEGFRAGGELLGDVVDDAFVGRGGRREHRRSLRQLAEQVLDPAVVGAEVMAPITDAVRLVDDEQTAPPGEVGQLLGAEPGVVEAFRAHEQDVHLIGVQGRAHLVPLGGVGGVHGHRPHPGRARPRANGVRADPG